MLFFDDWALNAMHNVKRRMGRPRYVPEATLVDGLTEGTWNFPFVWHDKKAGKWKALYGGALPLSHNGKIFLRAQALMYAESDDGIHWERPDVSQRTTRVGPRPASNIVYSVEGHIDGGPVFHDPKDEKFPLKYLFSKDGKQGLAGSPDGIEWHDVPGVQLGHYDLDSPITAYYNHHRDSYCLPRRLHCGDRRIALFETKDWKTFTGPQLIVHPTALDPTLLQFYGMPVYRYESLYLGLLWRLHCHPTEELAGIKGIGGPIDCSLAYSLDGFTFFRPTHDAFIPTNPRGEHGGGCVYTGCMVTDRDAGEIRFYSGGSYTEHFIDQNLDDAALMLHTLRLDGFFYLESYVMKGYVMTRTLKFTGDEPLRLNVKAPHGRVRVRITEPKGASIPGLDYDDCEPFRGDDCFWQPRWKDMSKFAALDRSQRYHIEVELVSAELYAIRGDFILEYGSGHENAPVRYTM